MDITQVIGDSEAVFAPLLAHLSDCGLSIHGLPVDHVAYRVETTDRYVSMHAALLRFSNGLSVTRHGGRQISTFRLSTPIHLAGIPVPLVELPAPKVGSPYPEGLEHIEVVVADNFVGFVQAHASIWTGIDLDDEFNPTAHITTGGLTAKFHPRPLDDVIALQGGYFTVVSPA